MSKIGLFYGPVGGSVEKVAGLITQKIGPSKVDVHKIKDVDPEILKEYSYIIMGLSTLGQHTWSSKTEHRDWDEFMAKLEGMNLNNRKLAIFGLGDHIGYANHFVDSIGDLAEVMLKCGVKLIGRCSTEGYEYNESRAEVDGEFLGLPIDEDFESEKTDDRLDEWLKNILPEFK